MPGPGGGYTLDELTAAGGNVYHPPGRTDITIVYYQYPGTSGKSGEIEFTQNPKTGEFRPKAGDNADRYEALSSGKEAPSAPAPTGTPKPQAQATATATPSPVATATPPATSGEIADADASATELTPDELRAINFANGLAAINPPAPADATASAGPGVAGTKVAAPPAAAKPPAATGFRSTTGGATSSSKPPTEQPSAPPPATPPPLTPTRVGAVPTTSVPAGFRDQWASTNGQTPLYIGDAARTQGLPTVAESNPGSVSVVSPQGGWGYNPFALRAGQAGLDVTAPNASGLASFNIPFATPPNERTGNFSPSTNQTQFAKEYQSNPYGNNAIEQAMLSGALVKPTPEVGNAYGGQALTSMQPYKRGGFIRTPAIQQADSMPPTDWEGTPRAYAAGGGLTIPEPARVIGQSGRVYATVGEVRPEELNPKPGGFSIVNHVPGTERYAQAGANQIPGISHADDGGFADSYDNSVSQPSSSTPAPDTNAAPATPTPTPGGLSSAPLPVTPNPTPTPAAPSNSISNLLGLPAVGNLGTSPQPPGQTYDSSGTVAENGTGYGGVPTHAALSDPTYQQQLAAYNRNLDQQDANLQAAAAGSEMDLLNRLGSPEAEAEKLANANLQHQRDSTDYKYGLAGMHTPVEVQPPYAFPGSPLSSSMGLPPGQRYMIESPEQQYQTLLGFAQNYFNAARNQISAAKSVSALNQPPAASLSSQLVSGISRASASATGGGAGFQNSFSINRGISG